MFKKTKNNRVIKLQEIPAAAVKDLRTEIISGCKAGKRLICLFAGPGAVSLYAVLADDLSSAIYVCFAPLEGARAYESITKELPAAHMFERELWEETGIVPEGHPWLKPVRYGAARYDRNLTMDNYPFFKMTGEEAHEVAVGPVHAGVIEPGHFRFMCAGEDVHHLEIQLGYQHRGVMKLFKNKGPGPSAGLAESIAGDTVIGHVISYCSALEALSGCEVPRKAHAIRAVALEFERAAMHTGGLSAIAGDIAYLPGNAVFGANRTTLINTLLGISGSRFGRGLIRPGGTVFDIDSVAAKKIKKDILAAYANIRNMCEVMFSSASVLSRLQHTGTVEKQDAVNLGMTGFAARASGVAIDARIDHPFGAYNYFPVRKMIMESGDVYARAYLRYIETCQSVDFITELMDSLPQGQIMKEAGESLAADSFVVSMAEGWRGPVVNVMMTDGTGHIKTHRIYDPSFSNWYGLALAVRGNGISDFPVCNKSFDLSYCGNDL